jgi:hypothetical protein
MADENEHVAAKIDKLVADLDRRQLKADYVDGASMRWGQVLEHWDAFMRFVQSLERAIRDPFGPESVHVLRTAETLHGDEVYRLAFALVHVAEAIGGRSWPQAAE